MNARFVFLLLLAAGSLVLAWQRAFLQDDAFITFIYARHFAEGYGLVWMPGSNEFGYTNFLFTLLVGVLMWLGFLPEVASALISIPSYVATVLLVFFITARLCKARFVPHIAAIATAIHYSVSSYATGGLETSFHMFLITLTCFFAFRYHAAPSRKAAWHVAIAASLALLCRLDSALLLLPVYFYLATHLRRNFGAVFLMAAVPTAAVAALLAGCYSYYGAALPNTFYAKLFLSRNYYTEGLIYFRSYLQVQYYFPAALLALVLPLSLWRRAWTREIVCLLAVVLIWCGYIISIGGDFMEFRLLVPILPIFHVICFALIARSLPNIPATVLSVLVLLGSLAANYHQQTTFRLNNWMGSIGKLHEQVANPRTGWVLVGRALGDLFYKGSPQDVSLAVHTAGAIPYYSRLPTVDIYGLNDRWVAQYGEPGSYIAGHRKRAPFSYLVQRKVNIVIPGLPVYFCGHAPEDVKPYNNLPALIIPLETDCKVVGYYLTPHPDIEKAIADGKIRRIQPKESGPL